MIFFRSEELYGDVDSETFTAVINLNPYGAELTVIKSKCIGIVQKMMGTRLKNVRKARKLKGKGKLSRFGEKA